MLTNLFNKDNRIIEETLHRLATSSKMGELDKDSIDAARILSKSVPKDFTNLEEYSKWRLALLIVEKSDGLAFPAYITSPSLTVLTITSVAASALSLVALAFML